MRPYLKSAVMIGFIVFSLTYFVPVAMPQHSFGVKEYDDFHHVLHPLEHEALPKNDFATIRARAGELVKLGQAITKLGVPTGTRAERQDEFKKELKKFREALTKFRTAAKSRPDAELKTTYSAVHDTFEMLAAMLPRN